MELHRSMMNPTTSLPVLGPSSAHLYFFVYPLMCNLKSNHGRNTSAAYVRILDNERTEA